MKVLQKSWSRCEKHTSLMSKVGAELGAVELDKITRTDPADNKNRRTLLVNRQNGSWGFTLQSYGIHHKAINEVQLLTYVDYVALEGPSYGAGLRPGDVILSINGISMEDADHSALVGYIANCGNSMRMVVLFEDCVRKVELHQRYLKLQRVLQEKMFELRALEAREQMIVNGNSMDPRRLSLAYSSSNSFASLNDDRLSLRPELDICPIPRSPVQKSVSPPSRGLSPICTTPVAKLTPRLEFERSSLPLKPKSRPQSTSDLDMDSSFVREKRPVSMNLKRSLDSISELSTSCCDIGKFPRRPNCLKVPSLSTSASTSTLERLCVDRWRNDGVFSPPSNSAKSPDGSTICSSPDGHVRHSSSGSDSRSLASYASYSSLGSPGEQSPHLKPRSSLRSLSFRHRMYSPQNPSPPSSSIVLTEENSREDGEPILLGVKCIARAFSFRMPWEQKARGEVYLDPPRNCDIHCQCSPQSLHASCSRGSLEKQQGSCESVATLTPSPLRSYKSREMLACSSGDWAEMDSLSSQLDEVSVSSSGHPTSNSSVSSYESSMTSGSYYVGDPFSSPGTPPPSSFQDAQLARNIKDNLHSIAGYSMGTASEHINERDEVTVL